MIKQVVCFSVLFLGSIANAQDVTVRGTICTIPNLNGNPIVHDPLAGATVNAYRRNWIGGTGKQTGVNGVYDFTVNAGLPFFLVFIGPNPDLVPECEELSADPNKKQEVHVVLLTFRQYEDTYGREALVEKLKYLYSRFRKNEQSKELISRIEALAKLADFRLLNVPR